MAAAGSALLVALWSCWNLGAHGCVRVSCHTWDMTLLWFRLGGARALPEPSDLGDTTGGEVLPLCRDLLLACARARLAMANSKELMATLKVFLAQLGHGQAQAGHSPHTGCGQIQGGHSLGWPRPSPRHSWPGQRWSWPVGCGQAQSGHGSTKLRLASAHVGHGPGPPQPHHQPGPFHALKF